MNRCLEKMAQSLLKSDTPLAKIYIGQEQKGRGKKNITRYVYITHYLRQLFMCTLINFDFCPTVSNRSTMEYVN